MNTITKTKIKDALAASRINVLIALAIIAVIIVAGAVLVITKAAGYFASLEPDAATLTSNAKLVNDASASGGKAIQFTAPSPVPPTPPPPGPTPTPPTPPPSGGACASGSNIPGSADPWGGCWPGPNNTGVPAGTVLSTYTGPCSITVANTVIDKKTINCDPLKILTSGVVIRSSKVNAIIDVDGPSYSLTIEDSELAGGGNTGVGYSNITVIRAKIHGAQHGVVCGDNCVVRDSYMYGQRALGGSHNNAIISNGGNNMQMIHNTLYCEPQDNDQGGGCSSDLSLFGDFQPITNVLVDKNLFMATPGGYCFSGGYGSSKPYGLQASNIDVTNNIFKRGSNGKCAVWGPSTSYSTQGGGVFTNNKWEDGATVNPN